MTLLTPTSQLQLCHQPFMVGKANKVVSLIYNMETSVIVQIVFHHDLDRSLGYNASIFLTNVETRRMNGANRHPDS